MIALAEEILDDVMENLARRKGFAELLDEIGDETLSGIREELVNVVDQALAENATVFSLLEEAKERAIAKRTESYGTDTEAAREFSIAVTSIEDAQMRYTRGIARAKGVFRPADLESVDAIAERRAFLDDVEASGS